MTTTPASNNGPGPPATKIAVGPSAPPITPILIGTSFDGFYSFQLYHYTIGSAERGILGKIERGKKDKLMKRILNLDQER
jgi:hypothetical protein